MKTNVIRSGARVNRKAWSISGYSYCLAGCTALASLASVSTAAYAGELFPYNPPAANSARQIEQRPPPPRGSALSTQELRKIDQLADEVRKLPPAQKQSVRTDVQEELDKAVSHYDLQRIRYYNELLRRIDRAR